MQLICPKCLADMTEIDQQGVKVDVCQGCHGIWLDAGELAQLTGVDEDIPRHPDTIEAGDRYLEVSTYICPRCQGSFETFEYRPGTELYIDRCTSCHGIFLEHGELAKIKQLQQKPRLIALETESAEQQKLRETIESELQGRATEGKRRYGPGTYLFQLLTALPVEVDNPRKKFPAATLGLVLANVAAFVLYAFARENLYLYDYAFIPSRLSNPVYMPDLLTAMFIHAGLLHLLFNMYFLWIFGDNVEERMGARRYLLFYLLGGVAAFLIHAVFTSRPDMPVVGASGAISAIMGAYLVLFPNKKLYQVLFFIRFKMSVAFYLVLWLGIQVVSSASGIPGVAWFAHIGGFVSGAVAMWLMQRFGIVAEEPWRATTPAG